MSEATSGALSGLRVIDLSEGVAGGYCTRLLAGLGADVIKIEQPGGGDSLRRLGPFPHDEIDPELSGTHLYLNAGKRSVELDLRHGDGRDALLRLAASAELVVDSLSENAAASLRLTIADLRRRNPALDIVSVTPWGRTGPYSDRPGNELTVEALCGFASLHGEPPREPLKLPGWQMEYFAGTYAALGALSALADPAPRFVDVSVLEAAILAIESRVVSREFTHVEPKRSLDSFDWFYPLNIWQCNEGALVLAFYHPRDWPGLALILGDEELQEEEHYGTGARRLRRREELDARLASLLGQRAAREVFEAAIPLRSAVGMVLDPAGLLDDPHLKEREAISQVAHPKAGAYSMLSAPFKINDAAWKTSGAPLLGEHTGEVLREAGVDETTPKQGRDGSGGPFRPLAGVRVLDLTTAWAGTSATRALGALGADVIKIESPHSYDGWRGPVRPPKSGRGNYADQEARDRPYERTPLFGTANRNKRAIGLHLACEEGRAIFLKLLERSDVVLSNFSARVLPNLGLDYDSLRQVKRDIIYLAMPAYGTTGPYKHGVAYGNTMEGMSGLSHRFGYEGGRPLLTHVTYGDPIAGVHAAVAVLAALRRLRETGVGAFIDLSQQETLLAQNSEMLVKHSIDQLPTGREGNKTFGHAPHGYYPSRDNDEWIAIAAPDQAAWKALQSTLESPDLGDAKFATNELRLEHRDELDELLDKATARHDKHELADSLARAGVIAAPVLRFAELQADPHITARGVFEEVDHLEVGPRLYPRMPLTIDGEPLLTTRPTPLFAQHNREVFGDLLGMSAEELQELAERDVVGDLPKDALRR